MLTSISLLFLSQKYSGVLWCEDRRQRCWKNCNWIVWKSCPKDRGELHCVGNWRSMFVVFFRCVLKFGLGKRCVFDAVSIVNCQSSFPGACAQVLASGMCTSVCLLRSLVCKVQLRGAGYEHLNLYLPCRSSVWSYSGQIQTIKSKTMALITWINTFFVAVQFRCFYLHLSLMCF